MKSYKELEVWKKSMELVKMIYNLTQHFPSSEIYGLTSQLRRAAVSIPSNIAEGYHRGYRKEYVKFLYIAFGSGAELETQLELARSLALAAPERFKEADNLLQEVMKMLNGLIHSLIPNP